MNGKNIYRAILLLIVCSFLNNGILAQRRRYRRGYYRRPYYRRSYRYYNYPYYRRRGWYGPGFGIGLGFGPGYGWYGPGFGLGFGFGF